MNTPGITESKDRIYILGDTEGLRALGETLILKSKMGACLSCTFTDGVNRPILIEHINDLALDGQAPDDLGATT